jgi:hypothetical protein
MTQAPTPMAVTLGGNTGGNTLLPSRVRDCVLEFKKGINRDPAYFTVLKDNKQWDSDHQTLKAQTCYQYVDDILDPNYVPTTAEDIALFDEKQKYMYSVLEWILQTDEGKVIVRSHDADRNAQSIYKELLQVITQSTEAMMDSGELLLVLRQSRPCVSRSGTTTRREPTRRAKYRGGYNLTRRRSTRRAPPEEAFSDEENYRLLVILLDKEAPNKESMVETDEV